jgi:hypothetical protein
VSDSLEARVKRIEDREQISECVIRYAASLDKADWELMKETIADPIFVDFTSWADLEAREYSREEWAGFARDVLTGFDARQHISPNHVITFESDDEATCTSYMFAQHLIRDVPEGDTFIMRGSYTNVMQRKQGGGWEMKGLTMHFTWGEGNENLHQLSQERFKQGSAA